MTLDAYSVPYFLQIELTYGCNSHCIFCYNPARERHHPTEQTWQLVHAVGEAQVPLVQLTGGEVSLLRYLNDFADYLAQYSKVSIVTNAIKRRELSESISKIFLSLHGDKVTHERITANPGTYDLIINNIRYYIARGFAVSADMLLCAANYDQMYELIRTATELGMGEVFINRFQGGGFGVEQMQGLMPSMIQFRQALDQIIAARNDFGCKVGFGTSIPLCIDERLITEGLACNCEMGIKFASIAPDGRLRLCNQALKSYGNILESPLEILWQDKSVDEYRDMSWVTGVCSECPLLERCGAGCRVDNSQSMDYCPDAFVRDLKRRPEVVEKIATRMDEHTPYQTVPISPDTSKRHLRTEDGLLILRKHPEKYLVRSNYSALVVDDICADLCTASQGGFHDEKDLWWMARAHSLTDIDDALLGRYVDHLVAANVLIERQNGNMV